MNQGKNILFLTTSNLVTNPRLVKEMDLAIELGYRVSVISFSFENWSTALNEKIKERFGSSIELKEIPAGRKPLFPWLLSTVFQKLNKFFYLFTQNNLSVISYALIKRSWLLNNELQKKREAVDFIVAHNPGSFYPAYVFSKQKNIPFGIDVEDYHAGETNDPIESDMIKKMMQTVLPAADYVTAASPLILEKVKEDCITKLNYTETVLNYFDSDEFLPPMNIDSKKLQIVWFSQYIDSGRGLEKFIETVKVFPDEVELHLYGELNESFYHDYVSSVSNVVVHPALPQKKLHEQLANYDIGLAAEDISVNLNRNICLTNKLLSYFQAGLYILASNTSAQKLFIQQYPEHGIITTLQSEDLKIVMQRLIEQKSKLRKSSIKRFIKESTINSKSELLKLSTIWNSILTNSI